MKNLLSPENGLARVDRIFCGNLVCVVLVFRAVKASGTEEHFDFFRAPSKWTSLGELPQVGHTWSASKTSASLAHEVAMQCAMDQCDLSRSSPASAPPAKPFSQQCCGLTPGGNT